MQNVQHVHFQVPAQQFQQQINPQFSQQDSRFFGGFGLPFLLGYGLGGGFGGWGYGGYPYGYGYGYGYPYYGRRRRRYY